MRTLRDATRLNGIDKRGQQIRAVPGLGVACSIYFAVVDPVRIRPLVAQLLYFLSSCSFQHRSICPRADVGHNFLRFHTRKSHDGIITARLLSNIMQFPPFPQKSPPSL